MSEQFSAIENVQAVQSYDVQSLVRRDVLGDRFAFGEVVETANRLVALFQKIPVDQLNDYPDQQAKQLAEAAGQQLLRFQNIQEFDPAIDNPMQRHQKLIDQINNSYQGVFNQLLPHIQYLGLQQQDFASIGNDARAALLEVQGVANEIQGELEKRKKDADAILKEVKAVAAEQGVSQQAIYFGTEADHHRDQAHEWLGVTIFTASFVAVFAVASLFIHELPWFKGSDVYQTVQIAISKVLIFAVLAYLTFLSAKNYLSYRHNEIVNRHRQNALTTFTALADATSDAASADIVLSHAAACIFSPQETGLAKQENANSDGVPSLQIIPRIGGISGSGS